MATQTGTKVVYGLDAITIKDASGVAITNLASANLIATSIEYKPDAELKELRSAGDALVGRIVVNPFKTLSFDCIPTDADSEADAILAKTALLGLDKKVIQISGSTKVPEINLTNWFVTSVSESGSNTDMVKIKFTCESHAGITADPA